MKKFNLEAYENFLIENNCIGFFDPPITLKSGRPGFYYINQRDNLENQTKKRKLAKFIYAFALDNGIRPSAFYGVPAGATPIGEEVTSLIDYLPPEKITGSAPREKPKGHGDPKDRYTVGPTTHVKDVAVIEDVTTTGDSVIYYVLMLQEAGIPVRAAITMATRQERRDHGRTVSEVLEKDFGVKLYAMTTASRLLPKVFKKMFQGRRIDEPAIKNVIDNILSYSRQYGEEEIDLSALDL